QHVALQDRCRNREAGELVDDFGEPLQGGRTTERWRDLASRGHAMPRREEAGECRGFHWLDLAPQSRERPPPQHPEDFRVAPLALGTVGPELAADQCPARK